MQKQYFIWVCGAIFTLGGWWLSTASAQSADAERDPAPATLVLMSWNVEWMFDHDHADNRSDLAREQSAPTAAYWKWKVAAVARAIAACDATIVALQEIEGSQTLAAIVKELRDQHHLTYRYAFIEGSDGFTEQDVGILQRSGLTHYRRHEQSKTMFDSQLYYNVSKHLVAEYRWREVASPLTVMNLHLRATAESEKERTRQGRLARVWLEPELVAGQDVVVLGDLNSEHPVGELAGEMMYFVAGDQSPQATRMVDLLGQLPEDKRRTHLILDKQFDRILVSPSMMVDAPNEKDWTFDQIRIRPDLVIQGQGNDGYDHWSKRLTLSTEELDVSDHYPVVATFHLR